MEELCWAARMKRYPHATAGWKGWREICARASKRAPSSILTLECFVISRISRGDSPHGLSPARMYPNPCSPADLPSGAQLFCPMPTHGTSTQRLSRNPRGRLLMPSRFLRSSLHLSRGKVGINPCSPWRAGKDGGEGGIRTSRPAEAKWRQRRRLSFRLLFQNEKQYAQECASVK